MLKYPYMNTKHLPLIVGISLPVIFIIITSIFLFLPSLFVNPTHNFIYSMDDTNYGYNQIYKNTYAVEQNRVNLKPLPLQTYQTYKGEAPVLYLYDVKKDSSHQITFDEAKKYVLDPGPSSPDGYSIAYNYSHNGVFEIFGSNRNTNGLYIEKKSAKKPLTGLVSSNGYYQNSFNLIGWVK